MKKLAALLVMTITAAGIMAAPAAAGERAGAYSLSPFIGGYNFAGDQAVKAAPVLGVRFGYDLTPHWGLEALTSFQASNYKKSDKSVNALSVRLDILYNFLASGPLVPYLAVGGGATTFGKGNDCINMSTNATDATFNLGGGIKYFLTDSIAVRGDVRHLLAFESPGGPKSNWEYSAGLTFLFEAAAPAAARLPQPAPRSSLSAKPAAITGGEAVVLSWTTRDVTDCDITPAIGVVNPQGSMTVTPAVDTTYLLACTGPGGKTYSIATVAVTPLPAAQDGRSTNPGSI
jgi:OOP family OmpA-OmpF porin